MKKEKVIFSREISKLATIRNSFQMSCKLDGTMVILSESNKDKLITAKEKIQEAINFLSTII